MAGTVILLCHFDGTSGSTTFTDDAGHTLTATAATVNTAAPKFGAGAGDFTSGGTARIVVGGSPADFNFGSQPFTVEAFVYFTSAPPTNAVVLSQWQGTSNFCWLFGIAGGQLALYWSTLGFNTGNIGATFTPTLNTWYHIAADRDVALNARIYVNGVVVASGSANTTFFASTAPCIIGNDQDLGVNFLGRIDEARITIGQAVYAPGPFTPPSAPFTLTAPVDLAGNLGGSSQYGKLLYGNGQYSRVGAFAPIFAADLTIAPVVDLSGGLAPVISFAADLDVHVNLIDLAGDIAPQIVWGGSLSLDLPLTALSGSFGFSVALGASSFVSGPLWADSEPCQPPDWVDSELCPPPLWTPTPPPQWQTPDAPGSYGLNAYGVGRYNPPSDAPWYETELCDGG